MKKPEKSKEVIVPVQPGPDIAAFMFRIEQKLAFIEKKMDAMIAQAPARALEARPAPAFVPQHRSQDTRNIPVQKHSRPFEIKPSSAPVTPLPAQPLSGGELPPAPLQGSAQGNSRGRRERILHKTVCADCQKDCEVPFKPTGERPVYCKECFSKRKSSRAGKPPVDPLPEAAPVAEIPEEVAPVVMGERKVTVTKKGVGKVTVSEIARPSAREVSPRAKPQRSAPDRKSRR